MRCLCLLNQADIDDVVLGTVSWRSNVWACMTRRGDAGTTRVGILCFVNALGVLEAEDDLKAIMCGEEDVACIVRRAEADSGYCPDTLRNPLFSFLVRPLSRDNPSRLT